MTTFEELIEQHGKTVVDGNYVFTFGKYKGRIVDDCYDPGYLLWCDENIDWFELDDELRAQFAEHAAVFKTGGACIMSVNFDPGNYSGHRFLADSYSALPRHEIARVAGLIMIQDCQRWRH